MKKATLFIWVIIVGFIALVIFQNQAFFLTKTALRINLGIGTEYNTPELANAVLLLCFFFAGLIIGHLFSFSTRFRAKRTTKKLNAQITSNAAELSGLKDEVNKLKGIENPVDFQPDATKLDLNATPKIAESGTAANSADKTVINDTTKETSIPTENAKDKSSGKKK